MKSCPSFLLDASEERAFRKIHELLLRRFRYDVLRLRQRNASSYEVVQVYDRCLQSLGRIRSYVEKGF